MAKEFAARSDIRRNIYDYTEAQGSSEDTAIFTLPYNFTSSEGTLSFAYYQSGDGSLSVTVCGSQQVISDRATHPNVPYKYIPYSCEGINDVEITFTATVTSGSLTRVLDIQLYETYVPSTVSPSVPTQTQSATFTQSITSSMPISSSDEFTSESPTKLQLPLRGVLQSAVIPAVSAVLVLLVIGMMIIAVFVYLRRRSRAPKPVGPVDQDDDPNLYNNPVYDSKEDGLRTPDLLAGIKSRDVSNASPAPHWSPEMDNQYEDFDGDQKKTAIGGPLPISTILSLTGQVHGLAETSEVDLENLPMYHTLERPCSEAIYEEGDHTYEQAQSSAKSSRNLNKIVKGQKGTNNTHGNSYPASLENQYEDFDGDQKKTVIGGPLSNNTNSSLTGQLHGSAETSEVELVNSPMYHTLERPCSESIYDEGDHTYEQADGSAKSSRNPNETAKRQKGTDDANANSSSSSHVRGVPQGEIQDGGGNGSSAGIAVLDDEEEYNALTFNQSADITRALKKPNIVGDNVNNGYGVLDLPENTDSSLPKNSPELHNADVYDYLDETTAGQQNRKPYAKDGRPNDKGDTVLQPRAESDYHNYQDPSQMERSSPRSQGQDSFSNDQYNVLDSGKQVGDYHVYQSTEDNDGDYLDLLSGEDDYSTIDHDQGQVPKGTGMDSFEPIYSDDVYSELHTQ